MNFERWILIGFSFLCIIAIFKLVPREKARDACVLFLFLQIITWTAGMEKEKLRIFIHFFVFAIAITTYSFFIEKYSSLIFFKKWNWFASFFSNLIILYIVKKFVYWFKKGLV